MPPPNRTFHCSVPDFSVRSIPDGDIFNVKRECLITGSEIFRDMFACCDAGFCVVGTLDEDGRMLELDESTPALDALFHLLHATPEWFVVPENTEQPDFTRVWQDVIPERVIPCPLLPSLFVLADKYALSPEIVGVLKSHLLAYASVFPLQVYGTASVRGFADIAAEASAYLIHPPLGSYAADQIRVIPTAEAYHQLVVLHDFRVRALADVLRKEEIFPHGYGACSRHSPRTRALWEEKKQTIVGHIEAATDVAALMEPLIDEFSYCDVCRRACKAAVAMLAYKCAKIPRRIDKVEPE